MSRELLAELDDARAFEATRRFEDLDIFHVPFDELTGSPATEAVLIRLAGSCGRVGVVGPSGSGKSSAIASVLGPFAEVLPESVIALRVPVAAADRDEVTEPRRFAQHLAGTVLRYSTEILSEKERAALAQGVAELRRVGQQQRSRGWTVGAPRLLADAAFSAQVQGAAREVESRLPTGEILQAVQRIVDTFRANDHEPFLIIDDSDTWVRIAGEDRTAIANEFFDRVVRMLAKDLDCGFVVAIHDEYEALEGYRAIQGMLSAVIRVPEMPAPEPAAARIIERRLELAGATGTLDELITASAVAALADGYRNDHSIRNLLRAVDRALQHASSDGLDVLGEDVVRAALAELG